MHSVWMLCVVCFCVVLVFVVCVSFGELECNTVLSCCYRMIVVMLLFIVQVQYNIVLVVLHMLCPTWGAIAVTVRRYLYLLLTPTPVLFKRAWNV